MGCVRERPAFQSHALIAKCQTAVLNPCTCTFQDHVECANGRITHLSIFNERLTGLFPVSLLKLTGRTDLDLGANHLTGTMPLQLAELTGLNTLASLVSDQIST
jgi:hypothetical protein